jgi:hypothetical protein
MENLKKPTTEVAEEQLMTNADEIRKPWITEHIISLIEEKRDTDKGIHESS